MARAPSLLPLAGVFVLGLAGIVAVTWGSSLATFHLGRAFAFLVPILGFLYLLMSSPEPLRFSVSTLLVLLPVLGVTVPPARWEISAFDVVAVMLVLVALAHWFRNPRQFSLVPLWYVALPLLLWLPAVVLALDAARAWLEWLRLLVFYIVFVAVYRIAGDAAWRARVWSLIALALLVSSGFVILQKLTGVDLSLYQARAADALGSVYIRRGSGLFQDPQKAGQFISVWFTVVTVLRVSGAFTTRRGRLLADLALLASVPALLFTVSRLAIAMGLAGAVVGALLFNRLGTGQRVLAAAVLVPLVALGTFMITAQPRVLNKVLPAELVKRFEATSESANVRLEIWKDSWRIIEEYPLTGIGPGNYREYWFREDPRLRRAHEAGMYVPDQPESGYLKVLYEGGLFGALGGLVFLGGFFATARARLRDGVQRATVWAVVLGMGAFLATFTTLFTVSDARNALVPLLLLAMLAPVRDKQTDNTQVHHG